VDHISGAPVLAAKYPNLIFAKFPWPEQDASYDIAWIPIREGDVIPIGSDSLTVLHTPGHSPDHVAFWHEVSRTLLTGDLVAQTSSVMIHWSGGGDMAAYLKTLERLMALEPETCLPAHGPVITDPAAVFKGHIDHRLKREQQVVDALRSGHSTVQAVADCLYDGLDWMLMPAARENVRAHLEKLRAEGRAFYDNDCWRL
jgi:glyoxylase-like metal-dependent hydrolase (beta-lactamase superfamily II)